MTFNPSIDTIRDGESVSAAVTNRPITQNDQNIRYMKQLLDAASTGEGSFARNCRMPTNALLGMAVYYNPATQLWEPALGTVSASGGGGFVAAESSRVWGVIARKLTGTTGDILVGGSADINLTAAVTGTASEGTTYYLSGATPGMLVDTAPPSGIMVLRTAGLNTDGTHRVLLIPTFPQSLNNHTHMKYAMHAVTAGTHMVPDYDDVHRINPADPTIEGWLPADHAIFAGNAPTGAKFGYNMSVGGLRAMWPPIPLDNAVLEYVHTKQLQPIRSEQLTWSGSTTIAANHAITTTVAASHVRVGDRVLLNTATIAADSIVVTEVAIPSDGNIQLTLLNTDATSAVLTAYTLDVLIFPVTAQPVTGGYVPVPPDVCIMNNDGIWWMTDEYDRVPWPLRYGLPGCGTDYMNIWFTKPLFESGTTSVLSLHAAAGSGLSIVCPDTGAPATAGHLQLDMDIDIAMDGGTTEPGHMAVKRFHDGILYRGPVVSSVHAGTSNVTVTGSGSSSGQYYGDIVVSVDNEVDTRELPVDTVRLDSVDEEYYRDVIALGFRPGIASELRCRVHVPHSDNISATDQLKLRFRILNRANATCPAHILSVSYRRIPAPATLESAVVLPTADTALVTLPTAAVTVTASDMYYDVETPAFDIDPGDVVLYSIVRSASDGFSGSLLLLQQRAVFVS